MFHNKSRPNYWLVPLIALCLSPTAMATSHAPKKPPYYFVSDSLVYQAKKHTITYIGHVKVDQGPTHLTGDKLVIDLTPTNQMKTLVDTGHPATYTTITQNHPGVIHAKADKITYHQITQMIYLDGHADVTKNNNRIRSPHITYDKTRGIVHTRGGPKKTQRTHIVVMPQETHTSHIREGNRGIRK